MTGHVYEVRAAFADGSTRRWRKRTKRAATQLASDVRQSPGCIEAATFNLTTGLISF